MSQDEMQPYSLSLNQTEENYLFIQTFKRISMLEVNPGQEGLIELDLSSLFTVLVSFN